MPRQVRSEYEGAVYHVMCRGDRREDIFRNDGDREMLLATLAETVGRTGWKVHAWVWMRNHYHLLIETPDPNLVRGMTWFQATYTTRFNALHQFRGHLFGGRYKAVLVHPEAGAYFRTLLDYLHLNPVRAGLIRWRRGDDLRDYRWSSLPAYLKAAKRPKWLTVERGFRSWEVPDTSDGRRELRLALAARIKSEATEQCGLAEIEGQSLQATLRRGWYYGPADFRHWLLEKAEGVLTAKTRGKSRQNYQDEEIASQHEATAQRLLDEGLSRLRWDEKRLQFEAKGHPAKVALAAAIRLKTTVSLAWLTERLHMGSPGYVSLLTRRYIDKPTEIHK